VDEQLRAQFLKEALFVAKLTHPYIVPIHDAVDEGGDLYLVFEFVEGETLARRLTREARLPLKEARRVMSFVAKAVDYAHGRHVLHRDIKPGNIMLGADGIARVMDFGIALESTRTATAASAATGGFLDASGTLRYMPPEQHYGKSVRQSDVYAMGVCLYETVTGHPPFAAATVDELLALKRAAKYPPPSSVIPGLPTDLDLLVASALAPDAARRVSSAAEFLDLLEGLPA
jgi:serine/threonine-protein kinase